MKKILFKAKLIYKTIFKRSHSSFTRKKRVSRRMVPEICVFQPHFHFHITYNVEGDYLSEKSQKFDFNKN